MTYEVLVTKKANKFLACVRQWPVILVEGESEDAVVRQAHAELQAFLAGGRIIALELEESPEGHPWQAVAGMCADDPDWEAFQAAMHRYREEVDQPGMAG